MARHQEYDFSRSVGKKLHAAGFVVFYIPESKYRTQIIDALVMKDQIVIPVEFKSRQSKYLKKWNEEQLGMQIGIFHPSKIMFLRILQGNKKGEINVEPVVYDNFDVEKNAKVMNILQEIHDALR